MSSRSERKSNIELLRIFAALGVIILHYNNPSLGGGFENVTDLPVNQAIMTFLEVLFICAVNLYVIITGYFMSSSLKRDVLKPIELVTQMFVFEIVFYLIKEIPSGNPFSMATLIGYFTPSYWFVFVYIALYLVSPYINLMWKHLEKNKKKTLLVISLFLFSVYPIFWEIILNLFGEQIWGTDANSVYGFTQGVSTIGLFGSQGGYSIVNFVLMYLIGAYLKNSETKISQGKLFVLLMLNIALIIAWTYAEKFITGNPINATTAWNYENPLVISESVIIFLIFKNAKIKNSKIINKLAAASFPSYLIHLNLLEYCGIADHVTKNPALMIVHIVVCVILIYIISFIIFIIYGLIFDPIFSYISSKWKTYRTYSV